MPVLAVEGLRVTVTEPAKDDSGTIKYKVCILHPMRTTVSLSRVFRRFSEFDSVFRKLADMHPDPPLPPLPEKKVFGNTEPAFIEKRRRECEHFIAAALQNRFLVMDLDFMNLIGFPEAKATYINDTGDPDGTSSPRQGGGLTAGQTAPSEAFEGTPWMRQLVAFDDQSNLVAAQGWVRSTPFSIQHMLPQLSFRPRRKTNILLQGEKKESYILSVYQPVSSLAVALPDDKRIGYFVRLLSSLDHTCFATPVDVSFQGSRAYVVRPVSKYGSLYDKLFNVGKPQEDATKKFGGKSKPFKLDDIASYGKQMLLHIKLLHTFNIPCGHLHLGNCLLNSGGLLTFSDVESLLLGTSRYPPVPPFNEDGEEDEKTHIDILRFGVCLLEMAMGMPLSGIKEFKLMTVQRADPTGVVAAGEDEDDMDSSLGSPTASMKSASFRGSSPRGGSPKPAHDAPILSTLPTLPDPLGQLIQYIFHRNNKADVDVLLKHNFFAKAKFKGELKAWEDVEYAHPHPKLKKKDLDLFAEASQKWAADLVEQSKRKEKEEAAKVALKEMRRNKSSRKRSTTTAASPSPAPVAASPPPSAPPPAPAPAASAVPPIAIGGGGAPPPAGVPPPPAPAGKAPPPAPLPKAAPPAGVPPPPPPPAKAAPPPAGVPPPAPPAGKVPPPPPPPAGKVPPPPPPAKGPPPAHGGGGGGGGGGAASSQRADFLAEIRRGTRQTFRGDD